MTHRGDERGGKGHPGKHAKGSQMARMDENQEKNIKARNRRENELIRQGYDPKHAKDTARKENPTPTDKKQNKK